MPHLLGATEEGTGMIHSGDAHPPLVQGEDGGLHLVQPLHVTGLNTARGRGGAQDHVIVEGRGEEVKDHEIHQPRDTGAAVLPAGELYLE